MAKVKVKFRASSVLSKEGTLYYQVIHHRVVRQINTSYKVLECEWDKASGEIVLDEVSNECRRFQLLALSDNIKNDLAVLKRDIDKLERLEKAYTADDVVQAFTTEKQGGGFLSFAKKQAVHRQKSDKTAASEKIMSAVSSLSKFVGKNDIPFNDVTPELIEKYEGWLMKSGVCKNTASFYMRKLRSVYNIAVENGIIEDKMPFKHVYTGIDQTVKRAISARAIQKVIDLDLLSRPKLDFARNIFLLSLMLRGMSFVDMCLLKKSDLVDGILYYRRQKTHQLMRIKWETPMQGILKKIGDTGDIFLLPIISNKKGDIRKQCSNALHNINRNLKKVGKMVKLEISLTTYVARHSWASLAQSTGVSIYDISEGLGHHSLSTTRIYLASISSSAVDKANNKVISLFLHNEAK